MVLAGVGVGVGVGIGMVDAFIQSSQHLLQVVVRRCPIVCKVLEAVEMDQDAGGEF